MNVFNSIYATDIDSFDRACIIAETTFLIDLERANKEYMLESGLIDSAEEDTFLEAAKKKNKGNVFSKLVESICDGIRKLFLSIGDAIGSIFGSMKHISPQDLQNSSARVSLGKDIVELDRVVDDEIRKGNALLEKASKSDNVTINDVDAWISAGAKKINSVKAVTMSIASAVGLGSVITGIFKKNKGRVDDTEKSAKSKSDNPVNNKTKKKILDHLATLYRMVADESAQAGKKIDTAYKAEFEKSAKEAKQEAKSKMGEAKSKYDSTTPPENESERLKRAKEFEEELAAIARSRDASIRSAKTLAARKTTIKAYGKKLKTLLRELYDAEKIGNTRYKQYVKEIDTAIDGLTNATEENVEIYNNKIDMVRSHIESTVR